MNSEAAVLLGWQSSKSFSLERPPAVSVAAVVAAAAAALLWFEVVGAALPADEEDPWPTVAFAH